MRDFGYYCNSVDLWLDKYTDGNISSSSDLIDFADGELSLWDMFDNRVPASEAARKLLKANGWEF